MQDQLKNTKSKSRIEKLTNRIDEHEKAAKSNIIFQGTNSVVRATIKYSLFKEMSEDE